VPLFSPDLLDRQQQVERLSAQLDVALEEIQALQTALTASQAALATSQAEVTALRGELVRLKLLHQGTLNHIAALGYAAPQPDDLEAWKRTLLTLCHPDKWSQGQLATELAHELAVTLNHRQP